MSWVREREKQTPQWINEKKITGEIRKYLEINENEKNNDQNLEDI